MKRILKTFLFVCALALCPSLHAQTNVTGTFLGPGGQSPSSAGIQTLQIVNGTPVCGELDFTPWNQILAQPVDMRWNGVTYLPSRVRGFVRCSDGQIVNTSGAVGVHLIPNSDAQPTGTVYHMTGGLQGSTDGTISPVSYEEEKEIPDDGSVDWTNLTDAQITNFGYSYVLQTNGYVIGFQTWQAVTLPIGSYPAAGTAWLGYNSVSKVMQCVNPDGSSCYPGGLTNPMHGNGSLIYGATGGTPTELIGNSTSQREFLISQGNGGSPPSPLAPAWGALIGADLPPPTLVTLGGVFAVNPVAHEWINSINLLGQPLLSQPTLGDFPAVAGNCIVASPANGGSAPPSCRSLVANDLSQIPIATYLPAPVRSGDILYWNSGTGWTTIPGNNSGTVVLNENASGVPSWQPSTAGITSIGLAQTGNIFVFGPPLVANGTINIAFANENQNLVFGNCGAVSGVPSFCSLTNAMLPVTTVTPGNYANANITVNAQGIITAAANGAATVANITVNGGSGLTGTVNFANGSAVDGITLVAANPSASNVTFAISGALTNAGIANPSITVAGATCTLGGSCAPVYSSLSGLPTLPANTPLISHEWLSVYNSTTGIFTQSQPAFSDISGTLTNAQLPLSGATAGTYTCINGTVNAQGVLTAAANGTCSGGGASVTVNGGSALGSPVNFQTSTGGNIVDGLTVVAVNSSGNNIQFAVTGNLTNAGLANSSIIVSGQTCVLGASCTIAYSGLTGTPQLPVTMAAVSHNFLTSYTSSSGLFTQAQPAFTDISGVLINSQLPTSAVTPGSYTNANITVNAQGIVTAAANGSGSGSNVTVNGGSALGSPVNFVNSAAVDGITLVASNPTANNVTFTLSGALTNAGLVNSSITVSGASCVLGGTCTVAYSGLSGLPALPANTPAVTNQVLTAYNSTSGAFTQAQLAYSSLSGLPSLEYQTVAASGTALPQEPEVNFIEGSNINISCVDNGSATRSDCTFAMNTVFGNVSNSGTPASPQLAQWVSSTAIQGISTFGGGANPLMATASGSLLAGQIVCANSSAILTNCTPGIPVVQQTSGSGFTMANSNRATLQVLSTTSAVNVTLPSLSTLPNNYFADFYNVNTGLATFQTSGGVFLEPGNATSQLVPDGWFSILYNDGTNYWLPTMPTSLAFAFANCGGSATCAMAYNESTGSFYTVANGTGFPLTVSGGVSGGIPYFSSTTTEASSALLASGGIVLGGGAGSAPNTIAALTYAVSGAYANLTVGTNSGTLSGALVLYQGSSSGGSVILDPASSATTQTSFRFPATFGISTNLLSTDGAGNTSWVTSPSYVSLPNDSSGSGTTLNKLAKINNANSAVDITITGDASGIVGIVTAGAGTSGNAQISISGKASCVFSNSVFYGDYVQNSGSTNGDCFDAGSSYPTSGQVLGRVLGSGSAGTYTILVFPPDIQAVNGAANVSSVGLQINGGSSSGIFGVTGSPVTTSGNLNYNLTLTSGGIPYASSTSVLSSSGLLTQYGILLGGGAGGAPTSTAALTNGEVCIGSNSAACVPATLTAGSNISITNAAGSITINATAPASPKVCTGSNVTQTDQLTSTGTFATTCSVPGSSLAVGSIIIVMADGYYTSTTGTNKLNISINAGGTTSICGQGTAPTVTSSLSAGKWSAECRITIAALGTSPTGQAWGDGSEKVYSAIALDTEAPYPSGGSSANFTTTSAQTVSVHATLTTTTSVNLTSMSVYVYP